MKYLAAAPVLLFVWIFAFILQLVLLAPIITLGLLFVSGGVEVLFYPIRMAAEMTDRTFK